MIITEQDMAPARAVVRPDRTEWLRPVVQLPQIRPYDRAFREMAEPTSDGRKAIRSQMEARLQVTMSLAMEMGEGAVTGGDLAERMADMMKDVDTARVQSELLAIALWSTFLQEDAEGIHLDDGHVRKALDHRFQLFPIAPSHDIGFVIHLPEWMDVKLGDGVRMDMAWIANLGNGMIQIVVMQTPGAWRDDHRSVHVIVPAATRQNDLAAVVTQDRLVKVVENSPEDDTKERRAADIRALAPRLDEICAMLRYAQIMTNTVRMDYGMRGVDGADRRIAHLPQIVRPETGGDLAEDNQAAFHNLARAGWRHVFILADS